jgi:hypothetical protein
MQKEAKHRFNVKFNDETEVFFMDYKESHGVGKQSFIQMAVEEKILRVKAELKLLEQLNTKK